MLPCSHPSKRIHYIIYLRTDNKRKEYSQFWQGDKYKWNRNGTATTLHMYYMCITCNTCVLHVLCIKKTCTIRDTRQNFGKITKYFSMKNCLRLTKHQKLAQWFLFLCCSLSEINHPSLTCASITNINAPHPPNIISESNVWSKKSICPGKSQIWNCTNELLDISANKKNWH